MNTEQKSIYASAIGLVDWLGEQIGGIDLPADLRSKMAAVCFGVTHEHYTAITIVLGLPSPLFGTALALQRPLFETCTRGLWLSLCASDQDLLAFQSVKPPETWRMLLALDQMHSKHESAALHLRRIWKSAREQMNGFTHGGVEHFQGWQGGEELSPAYDWGDALRLLDFSARIGILAASSLARIAMNSELQEVILSQGIPQLEKIAQALSDVSAQQD